jgi:uncharacterized protein YhdP
MPEASQGKGWATEARPPGRKGEGSGNPWPELDVVADQYLGRHGSLGRLELEARPDGADWQIRRFSLAHPAGTLAGEGLWRARGADPQTKLDVTLDVQDTPAYLAAFGLPGAVKGAPTKIQGQLVWKGAPDDFDYPSLGGSLHVAVGAGQFTKIDPGIGKLLGVLSLQALPRRITLDFRDVFSEGFAFDSIVGDVRIASGVMRTDELLLNGPAARVAIGGEVNLERETQRLTVKVMPSLATSVSAGAGAAAILLAAANPLVGAAIGAGTLLAQKMMKDPIEQIFSYEYRVSGSWTDPVVERVARGRSESADAGTPVGTPAQGTR